MSPHFKKGVGAGLIALSSFLLVTTTASINAPWDISGPFNFWPPPFLPVIVALFDLVPLCGIILGLRLLNISNRASMYLLIFLGVLTIALSLRNYVNAPPAEGRNDTDLVPAPMLWHLSVVLITAAYMAAGIYFLRWRRVK